MEPTLEVNHSAVYNRLSYVSDNPEYGDIVVFYSDEFEKYFAKRIIGIPGDTIEFINGCVYVNGTYLDESEYLDSETRTNCVNTFEVPVGCYFVLGDNRENSNDSRFWQTAYIPQNEIKGKYIFSVPFSIYSFLGLKD